MYEYCVPETTKNDESMQFLSDHELNAEVFAHNLELQGHHGTVCSKRARKKQW
jgi:hypothetical protein